MNSSEINIMVAIGKAQGKNTSQLLCDSIPECHLLTPPVTFPDGEAPHERE